MNYDPIGDDDHTDQQERDRVVAWLRALASRPAYSYETIGREALREAANKIEHGNHYTDGVLP